MGPFALSVADELDKRTVEGEERTLATAAPAARDPLARLVQLGRRNARRPRLHRSATTATATFELLVIGICCLCTHVQASPASAAARVDASLIKSMDGRPVAPC